MPKVSARCRGCGYVVLFQAPSMIDAVDLLLGVGWVPDLTAYCYNAADWFFAPCCQSLAPPQAVQT